MDKLISSRWVIPGEPDHVALNHHSVVIGNGKIVQEIRQFLLKNPDARRKVSQHLIEAMKKRKQFRKKCINMLKLKFRQRQ